MSKLHRQLGIVASLCVALLVLSFAHVAAAAAEDDGVASRGTGNSTATMCEMCCSPGGGDDACQFAFKGGPGVCCGSGIDDTSASIKFFCCPSRANVDVGFAKCYVSVADGEYRCRQPSRGEGRFVEEDRYYRRSERRRDFDGVQEGGVSLFNLVLGCIFTAFLVRGCLARQREQLTQEFAYHYQQQHASHAQRGPHAAAMGIPVGPGGQPVGGVPLQAMGGGVQPNYSHPHTPLPNSSYSHPGPVGGAGYLHGQGYGLGGLAGAGGLGFLGGLMMGESLGSHRHQHQLRGGAFDGDDDDEEEDDGHWSRGDHGGGGVEGDDFGDGGDFAADN